MAYIKARTIRGHVYYTLTRSYRKDSKVRQETLFYLGKFSTVEACYQHWKAELRKTARKYPLFGTAEDQEAWGASFRGGREIHKLRAEDAVKFLEEYRTSEAVKADEDAVEEAAAKRAAKYATPKEQAKRAKREAEREAEEARLYGTPEERAAERAEYAAFRAARAGKSSQVVSKREAAAVVLGVRSDAPPAVIKAAYRALAKERHSDLGGTDEAFRPVREAYEIMTGKPGGSSDHM